MNRLNNNKTPRPTTTHPPPHPSAPSPPTELYVAAQGTWKENPELRFSTLLPRARNDLPSREHDHTSCTPGQGPPNHHNPSPHADARSADVRLQIQIFSVRPPTNRNLPKAVIFNL